MAKKMNSSGQLQEYVPAGNGDASGEYADSGGSNRHFATFGKPQNPEAISGNQKEQPIKETKNEPIEKYYIQDKKSKQKSYISKEQYDKLKSQIENGDKDLKGVIVGIDNFESKNDYIKQAINSTYEERKSYLLPNVNNFDDLISELKDGIEEETDEDINKFIDEGGFEEIKTKFAKERTTKFVKENIVEGKTNYKLFVDALDKTKIPPEMLLRMSNISENSSFYLIKNGEDYFSKKGEIRFSASAFMKNDDYNDGEVITHEFTHAIDYSLDEYNQISSEYVSKYNGKTLGETVNDELQQFTDNSGIFKELKDNVDAEIEKAENNKNKELIKELNIKLRQKNDAIEQYLLSNQEYKEAREKFSEAFKKFTSKATFENQQAFNQTRDKMWSIGEKLASTEEYQRIESIYGDPLSEINELQSQNLKEKLKAKSKMFMKYGDLSDMVQAARERKGLFSKNICGGHDTGYFSNYKNHQGTECFAEIMSAKYTNSQSYETLKKYIPETLKVFDEIEKELLNGRK